MFAYDTGIEPPVSAWEEYEKPEFIVATITKICEDIVKRGSKSKFSEIFDMLYEHVDDNLELFEDEVVYDVE